MSIHICRQCGAQHFDNNSHVCSGMSRRRLEEALLWEIRHDNGLGEVPEVCARKELACLLRKAEYQLATCYARLGAQDAVWGTNHEKGLLYRLAKDVVLLEATQGFYVGIRLYVHNGKWEERHTLGGVQFPIVQLKKAYNKFLAPNLAARLLDPASKEVLLETEEIIENIKLGISRELDAETSVAHTHISDDGLGFISHWDQDGEAVHEDFESLEQENEEIETKTTDPEWSYQKVRETLLTMDPGSAGYATHPAIGRQSVKDSLLWLTGKNGKQGFVYHDALTYDDRVTLQQFASVSWDEYKKRQEEVRLQNFFA